ncbi:MAG: hypothetical protein ACFE95_14875 [Candidatus Hodarchaeota archaeon]
MSGKDVFASVVISLVVIGATTLIVMPQLYPVIQTDIEDIQSDIDDLQSGAVLQTKELVTNDHAMIDEEDNTTLLLMNNTILTISIRNDSRINARFSAVFRLVMKSGYVKHADYRITLMLQGVSGQSTRIYYSDYLGSTTNSLYLTSQVSIEYLSSNLEAGNYTIAVWWQSLYDNPSANRISRLYASDIDFYISTHAYSRTLIIQELAG